MIRKSTVGISTALPWKCLDTARNSVVTVYLHTLTNIKATFPTNKLRCLSLKHSSPSVSRFPKNYSNRRCLNRQPGKLDYRPTTACTSKILARLILLRCLCKEFMVEFVPSTLTVCYCGALKFFATERREGFTRIACYALTAVAL